MKDKMPTEVTSTRVPRGLLGAILAVVGGEAIGEACVSEGYPWWYGPLTVVITAAVWWAIYAYILYRKEKAKHDGVTDENDTYWQVLARAWTRQKISQVQPEPDEGEETKE